MKYISCWVVGRYLLFVCQPLTLVAVIVIEESLVIFQKLYSHLILHCYYFHFRWHWQSLPMTGTEVKVILILRLERFCFRDHSAADVTCVPWAFRRYSRTQWSVLPSRWWFRHLAPVSVGGMFVCRVKNSNYFHRRTMTVFTLTRNGWPIWRKKGLLTGALLCASFTQLRQRVGFETEYFYIDLLH